MIIRWLNADVNVFVTSDVSNDSLYGIIIIDCVITFYGVSFEDETY